MEEKMRFHVPLSSDAELTSPNVKSYRNESTMIPDLMLRVLTRHAISKASSSDLNSEN